MTVPDVSMETAHTNRIQIPILDNSKHSCYFTELFLQIPRKWLPMPIFGNKFSPKKVPLRKNSNVNLTGEKLEELVGEQRVVKLGLGDQELVFENGEWIPSAGKNSSTHKLNQKLKKRNQELQEENNLLRIKYEVVLNMLTQTTAESHIQEKELEKLRKVTKK